METKQALDVLEQGLELSNKGGVFTLQNSATVFTALNIIKNTITQFEEKAVEAKPLTKEKK